jgi:hypothetical protein
VAKKVPNACACFLRAGVYIIVLMSANLETLAVYKFATKRRVHVEGAFCSSWDMNSMYDHLIKCLCHCRWRLDINSSQPRDCAAQRKKLFMEPPVILLIQVPTSRRALSLT